MLQRHDSGAENESKELNCVAMNMCILCISPALSQRHFEQRFGQAQLLFPHSVGQNLSVSVVSVGLVAQLEQLPDSHTQRPGQQGEFLPFA